MKKWIINLFLIFVLFILANKANGQTYTQIFIDKCTGEIKTATTTYVNGNAVVSFYNQVKTFTPIEIQNGALQTWLQTTYLTYNSAGCPTNTVVQQAVTQTVQQAASQAATQAASTAAGAVSGAASAAASGAVSSASSTASSSISSTSTPPPSSSQPSSSSSSQSSSSSSSSSSSESSGQTKSESSGSKEEKKEEKKEEEKKDDKKKDDKKQLRMNPILVNSDLTIAQNPTGKVVPVVSIGLSQGSATGESSWGVNSMIFTDLKSFALSGNKSKMVFKEGQLKAVKAYSYTYAWMRGIPMMFGGYNYVIPHPKYGTIGFNTSIINLKLKSDVNNHSYQFISSLVGFWTKPYKLSAKSTISPGVFLMASPYSYNNKSGNSWNYNIAGLIGTGYTYQISKRFVLALDYKLNASTAKGVPLLIFVMIGSRTILL